MKILLILNNFGANLNILSDRMTHVRPKFQSKTLIDSEGSQPVRPIVLKACLSLILTVVMTSTMLAGDITLSQRGQAFAQAKKSKNLVATIRYSYKKQTLNDSSQYVLIPIIERLKTKTYTDFKERQRALFLAMKSDKKSNYGATKFNAEKGVVFVFLDPKKSRNDRFIMAEAIYTFTANGAKAVRFPRSKYDGRDFTRAHVSLPAYQLVLPYWRSLPPTPKMSALFDLGDGSTLTFEAVQTRLKEQDETIINQVVKTLKSGQADAVNAIIAANAIHMIKGIEAGLFPLLESAQTKLRLAAITGLKGRTSPEVYRALRKVMDEDPEDTVKDAAAEQLAQAKDKKISIAAVFHTLRSPKAKVAVAAAQKLGTHKKTTETVTELVKALKREEPEVRRAVIQTLIQHKATAALVKLLDGETKLEVKIEVAQAIMKNKKAKKAALNFLVAQPNGQAAAAAIQTLEGQKLKGDVISWFERALRHPDSTARITAATVLAQYKKSAALKVLAKGDIEDSESGEILHDAMRQIYARQSDKVVLNDAARQSSISLKSAAAGTLGKLYKSTRNKRNQKRAFQAVGQLAQSPKAIIRAEAVRSLGEIGTPESMAELLKLKDDSSVKVKRAIANSAVSFPEVKMRDILLDYLKSDDVRLLEYTLKGFTALKSSAVLNEVSQNKFIIHKDVKVRRASMEAIANLIALVKREERDRFSNKLYLRLNKEKDARTRILAAQALAHIPSEESRDALSTQLQDKDVSVVKALVDALITHELPASVNLLEGAMDHSNGEVRSYAYDVTSQLKPDGLRKVVKKLFKRRLKLESDAQLKSKLQSYLK
jgi:HEAT repeat protein